MHTVHQAAIHIIKCGCTLTHVTIDNTEIEADMELTSAYLYHRSTAKTSESVYHSQSSVHALVALDNKTEMESMSPSIESIR